MLIGISPHGQTLKFAPTLVPYESLEKIIYYTHNSGHIEKWVTQKTMGRLFHTVLSFH